MLMAEQPKLELAPTVDAGQVAGIIAFLVLIIIGAYLLTRYIGHKAMTRGMSKDNAKKHKFWNFGSGATKQEYQHQVQVVDRIAIDRDKTLMVVEFNNKKYLIGTTPDGFEKIDQVSMPKKGASAQRAAQPEQGGSSSAPKQSETAHSPLSDRTTSAARINAEDEESSKNSTHVVVGAGKSSDQGEKGEECMDDAFISQAKRTLGGDEVMADTDAPSDTDDPVPAASSSDVAQETFWQRFKRAFGIVLQSYLPKNMRSAPVSATRSFDEELKARIRADDQEDSDQQSQD